MSETELPTTSRRNRRRRRDRGDRPRGLLLLPHLLVMKAALLLNNLNSKSC